MKSIKLNLLRISGKLIPYEYNYFLGIGFYKKLLNFQENILKLHTGSQIGIYTFSNIIPAYKNGMKFGDNGLDIEKGYIIFRTLNENLVNYLRLSILEDPTISIKNTTFKITRVEDIKPHNIETPELQFKTISPILVRNYSKKNIYVDKDEEVLLNLKAVMEHQISNYFLIPKPAINFSNLSIKRKTIRISSNGRKESITSGFNLTGVISASPEVLKILYYKGLGSKTALGLGCWEAVQ